MFTTTSQLDLAVHRLLPALGSETEAQEVVAETLGLGSWLETRSSMALGQATYSPFWKIEATARFYANRGVVMNNLEFDSVFCEPPPATADELLGKSAEDIVRLVVRSNAPYGLRRFKTGVGQVVRHRVTALRDGLELSAAITHYRTEPGLPMGIYDWTLTASIDGQQVGHAVGDLYRTRRNAAVSAREAIYCADHISDVDVSNVRTICAQNQGVIRGSVATLRSVYLLPEHRGRFRSRAMLDTVAGTLAKGAPGIRQMFVDEKTYLAGVQLAFGSEHSPEALFAALRESLSARYLAPIRQTLAAAGVQLVDAPIGEKLGGHQVMELIGRLTHGQRFDAPLSNEQAAAAAFRRGMRARNSLFF